MLLTPSIRRSASKGKPLRSALSFSRFFDSPSSLVTTDPSYTPFGPPPLIEKKKVFHFAWLSSRSLIRLTGPDVFPFLQGLITANITKFEGPSAGTRPIYTAFLNAQGRVLNDVFLWRSKQPTESDEAPWLIDVDTSSRGSLLAHLKKHKLRSKVKLDTVSEDELRVYQGWVDEENCTPLERKTAAEEVWHHKQGSPPEGSHPSPAWTIDKGVNGSDPRPRMGMRWIGTAEGTAYDALRRTMAFAQSPHREIYLVSEDEYKLHRMLHGIAEGQSEIISGSALPQESNVDFFNGIDFRKGCYLGQELTIRTHHTGVVRKRILPVQLHKEFAPILPSTTGPTYVADPGDRTTQRGDPGLPPPGSNISKVSSRGRSTGKWLGGVGNIGLALCRLEMMTDIRLTEEPTQYDPDQEFKISWEAQPGYEAGQVKVKAFVPHWLRESIAASLKSRERSSTNDEGLDEVD